MTPAAHIAGVPFEEALAWLVPLSALGLSGLLALVRAGVGH